jgi:hypothetical protein
MLQITSRAKERREEKRERFALSMRADFTAHQLVWIDETRKDDRTLNRLYGYSKIGTPGGAMSWLQMRGLLGVQLMQPISL